MILHPYDERQLRESIELIIMQAIDDTTFDTDGGISLDDIEQYTTNVLEEVQRYV